ncbi:MAG: hypothetical protein E7332_07705 [Clostridiales bacterium]|nr:hypothetical protein [Clostridiales bacterium]MBP3940283.1 cyclic-di-AMP receptor [Christensenellaceae bacterium]MBR2223291.1 cyclic-di-AMP receptor [Christensenellaceae bacterium]MBR3842512.1 cyclic-di-AMP receptor [Christensenellaceae bacterium]
MKLMIVIVQDEDAGKLLAALNKKQIRVTRLSTTGGFLRRGNTTLLIGIENELVDDVKETIREYCKRRITNVVPIVPTPSMDFVPTPVQVEIGGATIFMFDCEQERM